MLLKTNTLLHNRVQASSSDMPRLLTRCISEDYQTVIDTQDVIDRGELDLSDLETVLHSASYMMPHSADPESPYRPAIGVMLANEDKPAFFYASDYQGSFSLKPDNSCGFSVDDILGMVQGETTVEDVQANKIALDNRFSRGVYIALGSILLVLLYFACAPIFGW